MHKNTFIIEGLAGKLILNGEVIIGGAKNAALKVMASSILFEDKLTLTNVPDIEDIKRIGELLSGIGVSVDFSKADKISLLPDKNLKSKLLSESAKATRSSIVLTGPLLARTGSISFPNPGGCNLGARPIDLFIEGFTKLGATVKEDGDNYNVSAPKGLRGTEFFFRVQSHTGTETLMMAAILAKGKTVLKNCALEPEVKSLADFLNLCGAKIEGAGTSTITIKGGRLLKAKGKIYKTIPDRIETGSFMILGALAARKLVIKNCEPKNVEIVTAILGSAGVKMDITKNSITIFGNDNLKAVNARTHEYPGLPTDLQALMAVFLTQTKGESTLFETIYEGRLGYVQALSEMGANIKTENGHRAIINGQTKLNGKKLKAPDLRAGFAFVIAGIIANGTTEIENTYVIDRGYANLPERLSNIGVNIKRV